MKPLRRARWSDNDHYLGPFTYARDGHYKPLGISLCSGDDEGRGCSIRFSGFGHTLISQLPPIIRPWRRKVHANWDAATRLRLGRNWYWDTHRREYGFSIVEGALHLRYGRQTHDSTTDQSSCYFLPWKQWRHVRHSLYGLEGQHFADMPESRCVLDTWTERKAIENACPKQVFAFDDYDGERIEATVRIEEREWHFGTGWWRWLSWFRRPKISRSLDISFSKEVGPRKGSWKGGTIGHSIEMLPGELHEAAFRRYCTENDMTFVNYAQRMSNGSQFYLGEE